MSTRASNQTRRALLRRALQLSAGAGLCSAFPQIALAQAPRARVTGVLGQRAERGERVIIELDAARQPDLFALHDPERLVLDFPRTEMIHAPRIALERRGALRDVRYAPHRHGTLRIVLDLRERVPARTFLYPPDSRHRRFRLVVDLGAAGDRAAHEAFEREHRVHGRDVLVVIDPGHGGKDPGAIGLRGTYEKTVVLDMGHRLHRLLQGEPGIRSHMTRHTDVFLPLVERVNIARARHADLFVSVHADASVIRHVRGTSVYILSRHGASSPMARRLAHSENMADLVGGGARLARRDSMLASVLLDLTRTGTLQASDALASALLHRMEGVGKVFSHNVERAGFVVLKAPDIPSTLVETAFISNPVDERRLLTPAFRQQVAEALHTGIRAYFRDHAPPDTRIAALARRARTA